MVGPAAAGLAALLVLAACDLPFGLGLPTTRALESGVAGTLDAARSFKITGSYTEPGGPASSSRTPTGAVLSITLELARPSTKHLLLTGGPADLEAVIVGAEAYFRGRNFLSSHMGSDPLSLFRVKAAGDAWWKGSVAYVPDLPDFTTGSSLVSTFLGSAVTTRTDHVSVGGVAATELSGPRADVFIAEAPPHQLLRLHMSQGAVIDGIVGADLRYTAFDRDFGISAPVGAIDFADLSTLPPIYTVESVDTSGCGLPCVVSATLKNIGGRHVAQAPSTITFTMADPATSNVLGSCTIAVQPDVAYNSVTTASCTIGGVNGADHNAAVVTATADNPGLA